MHTKLITDAINKKQDRTNSSKLNHNDIKPQGYRPLSNPMPRILGNQGMGHYVQTKLKVGQPNDKYEQEADQVADQVMRISDFSTQSLPSARHHSDGRTIQRTCASCSKEYDAAEKEGRSVLSGNLCPQCKTKSIDDELIQIKPVANQITPLIQRQEIPEEEENEDKVLIQTKSAGNAVPEVSPEVGSSIQSLRGRGRPLSPSEREFFEPRFGTDFSHVKIHNDCKAADMASQLNAKAFTIGSNIAFGAGQFAPSDNRGQRLLAHELTHVLQQSGHLGTMP